MAYISFKPSNNYSTKIFTGTGSTLAVTGVGFQPDFVWQKNRSITSSHLWTDAVRGTDSQLYTNSSSAEGTLTNVLTSFDSDGFTAGTSSDFNGSGNLIVTWNWKAGTTSGIATDGNETITPTSYSFNQTAGFSIIKYTGTGSYGQKFPHGLGVAPDFVITKPISANWDWGAYHSKLNGGVNPGEYALYLSGTNTKITSDSFWDDTAPTAFNVSLGDNSRTNISGGPMLAYCFAEKKGYSKFGCYYGRASTNNVFVYTGFKPAFLMVKNTDSADNWMMQDNRRIGYNVANYRLVPNTTGAEDTSGYVDFLSNGFKIRNAHSGIGAANNYIYIAFAENPMVGSNKTPDLGR